MRVHCVGVGSIGSVLAFHLRRSNPSPDYAFTILSQRGPSPSSHQRRRRVDEGDFVKSICVESNGIRRKIGGFDVELLESSRDESYLRYLSKAVGKRQEAERPSHLTPLPHFNALRNKSSLSSSSKSESSNTEAVGHQPAIDSLVVTTKAGTVKLALESLRHRLNASSTVVLLQNGMGVYDHLVQDMFPNPDSRPNFIIASTTHGAWAKRPYDVVHAGVGTLEFGIVPDPFKRRDFEAGFPSHFTSPSLSQTPTSNIEKPSFPNGNMPVSRIVDSRTSHISLATTLQDDPKFYSLAETTRALLRCADLSVSWKPMSEMEVILRRKLAVNASIGPLTSLISCPNGALYGNTSAHRLVRSICEEAALVFAAQAESQMSSGNPVHHLWATTLSRRALEAEVFAVLRATSKNLSSMLQDVRHGKVSEIEYINGYIARVGREYGIPTPVNSSMMEIIRMKRAIPSAKFQD